MNWPRILVVLPLAQSEAADWAHWAAQHWQAGTLPTLREAGMAGAPTCRGCHAIIRWVKTRHGASMPVDPEFLTEWLTNDTIYWTTSLSPEEAAKWARSRGLTWPLKRVTLITPEGDTVSGTQCSAITNGSREVKGYVPHWATCPDREKFGKEYQR